MQDNQNILNSGLLSKRVPRLTKRNKTKNSNEIREAIKKSMSFNETNNFEQKIEGIFSSTKKAKEVKSKRTDHLREIVHAGPTKRMKTSS